MSAVILAKTITDRQSFLHMRGEVEAYVGRLASYRLFSVGEMAQIADISEYRVRKSANPDILLRAKSGILPRHLDHVLRMIDNPTFSKIHVKALVEDGATLAALSRVTGQPETSLRRWAREE